jgi:two-component system sensor histidine kinase and response regulator WspE
MEAEKHFTRLTEDLIALKNEPARSDLFESMIRDSHSMKDAARIVNLHEAVRLTGSIADVLSIAQQEEVIIGRNDIDTMLNCVGLLKTLARVPDTDTEKWLAGHSPDIERLLKTLEELTERVKSGKPVPARKKSHPEVSSPEVPFSKIEHNGKKTAGSEPTQRQEDEKKHARRSDDKNRLRAVRVSARSMDRMMGLAGESLLESRWLPTFNAELLQLKRRQV